MKFCSKKRIEYKNDKGIDTSVNFVTEQDMINFHGLEFVGQWKVLARSLTKSKFGNEEGYYYSDYQHFARATDSFINAV